MSFYANSGFNSVNAFEQSFRKRIETRTSVNPRHAIAQDSIEKVINDESRFSGTYEEYLGSQYWKLVRSKVLIRDGFRCTACLSQDSPIVHHLNYDFVRNELDHLSSLTTLCKDCHADRHAKLVEEQTSIVGSKHRIMMLLRKWQSLYAPMSLTQLSEVTARVDIKDQSFEIDLLSKYSINALWPSLIKWLDSTHYLSDSQLQIKLSSENDKTIYQSSSEEHTGKSIVEVCLSMIAAKLDRLEREKAEYEAAERVKEAERQAIIAENIRQGEKLQAEENRQLNLLIKKIREKETFTFVLETLEASNREIASKVLAQSFCNLHGFTQFARRQIVVDEFLEILRAGYRAGYWTRDRYYRRHRRD